ncbi:MAG: hypothetical protein HRU28_15635 [Rhizobiales bacterium]|nr:hypothetical protein [Hyphomicrobiales bacterium]
MELKYIIIYVDDVPNTVKFYEDAFGLTCRFMHESNQYAEMETGATALAFAVNDMAEMNGLAIMPNLKSATPAGWEICLVTDNIKKAYVKGRVKLYH